MLRYFRISLVMSVASMFAGANPARSAELTTREIVEIVKRREASFTTGTIEWEERVVHSAGSFTLPGTARFPSEDETTTATRMLAWDGPLMSYRFEDYTPSKDRSKFVPMTYANVCGGKEGSRSVWIDSTREFPSATTSNSKMLESAEDVNLIPVLLWAKPTAGECYRLDAENTQILPERQRVEGRDCLILSRRRGSVIDQWFVDDRRGCVTQRYEVLVDGRRKIRIDVVYTEDQKHGWVPSEWQTVITAGNAKVETVRTGTIKSLVIGEKPNPKAFELPLPLGAMVYDEVRKQNYVIRRDGTERILTPEDVKKGTSYRDLLKLDNDK